MKEKSVLQGFHVPCFLHWLFLTYAETSDVVYCNTCLMALQLKRLVSRPCVCKKFEMEIITVIILHILSYCIVYPYQ